MSTHSNPMAPIAIIGGGLSGMTLAFELHTRGVPFVLYESSDHLGGALRTRQENGYLVEQGPNGFLNNAPATLDLLKRLNLENEIQEAKTDAKIRYIYSYGKLQPVPTSPPALFKSDLIPFKSKMRLLTEALRRHSTAAKDETIFTFLERHFDKNVAAELAVPFTIGVFAGDASRLSIHECFSSLVALEKTHGSLIKGMLKSSVQPRLNSLKNGMESLVQRIQARLPLEAIRTLTPVTQIQRQNSDWNLTTSKGSSTHSHLVFACPPKVLAALRGEWLPAEISQSLGQFPTAPVRTLSIAFRKKTSFRGFGTLIKPSPTPTPPDRPVLLGFLHPTDIFPNRAPLTHDLITTLWGGVWQNQALHVPERELLSFALQELEKILEHPLPAVEKAWDWFHNPGIPQYDVSIRPILDQLRDFSRLVPGAFIHSNLVGGVSMNDCITKSVALSNQITMLYKK